MNQIPHVIIIEDDVGLGAAIAARIRHLDLKVTVMRDGTDAARRIHEEAPELIVLDFAVPGMNGLEIAEAIFADSSSRCEMILYTGSDCQDTARRAAMSGIQILRKNPGSLFELQREIAGRLDRTDADINSASNTAGVMTHDATDRNDKHRVTRRFESQQNPGPIIKRSPHTAVNRSKFDSK
jgi:DNA-binding response OmpR family regulator